MQLLNNGKEIKEWIDKAFWGDFEVKHIGNYVFYATNSFIELTIVTTPSGEEEKMIKILNININEL